MSDLSPQQECRLEQICDDVQRRLQNGQDVSPARYTDEHPDLASQINDALNALTALVRIEDRNPTPKQVGGCRIRRELGVGGMGTVYEAEHQKVSRRLAIKLLNRRDRATAEERQRFLKEAEAASRLSHPNIVPLLDVGEDNGLLYLSMPLIEGRSLDCHLQLPEPPAGDKIASSTDHLQFLNFDGLAERTWAALALKVAEVADALQHAHDSGIIHRDIKPANLIHSSDGRFMVTDFGLAKLRDYHGDLSQAGDIIGTPRYMSPEQIRGHCDPRSDIYSLGVTLYELASGARAWNAEDSPNLLSSRSTLELPDVSVVNADVPATLAVIIATACSLHPEDRFQTAEEFGTVLRRFADDESIPASYIKSAANKRKRPIKNFFFAVSGAAVLAFAGLATIPDGKNSAEKPHLTSHIPEQLVKIFSDGRQIVAENQTAVNQIIPDLSFHRGLVHWQIVGGADSRRFEIDSTSGRLQFISAPDYEEPRDADLDNQYDVVLSADSDAGREQKSLSVAIENTNEPPQPSPRTFRTTVMAAGSIVSGLPLSIEDPEGDAVGWNLEEHTSFRIHRFSGRVSALNDLEVGTYQLNLIPNDQLRPQGVVVSAGREGLAFTCLNTGQKTETNIAEKGFRCIATPNGKTFFHVHDLPSGPSLLRSRRTNSVTEFQTTIIASNCTELNGIVGLATENGQRFAALFDSDAGGVLRWFRIRGRLIEWEDGSQSIPEHLLGRDIALLIKDDAQFLGGSGETDGLVSEFLFSAATVRALPLSISATATEAIGLATWLEYRSEGLQASAATTVNVKFDGNL